MFRPSITLPESIRESFAGELENQHVSRIPVAVRSHCPHLLFNPPHLPVYQVRITRDGLYNPQLLSGSEQYHHMPGPGGLCWLIFEDPQQRFLGYVIRVAEYQESRLILLVGHVRSPAIVSVAVPYEYYDGVDESQSLWTKLVSWLCKQPARYPDHERPIQGMYQTHYTINTLTLQE